LRPSTITELDRSRQHERGDTDRFVGSLTSFRESHRVAQGLRLHTPNRWENSGRKPAITAKVQSGKSEQRQSAPNAYNHSICRRAPSALCFSSSANVVKEVPYAFGCTLITTSAAGSVSNSCVRTISRSWRFRRFRSGAECPKSGTMNPTLG